MHIFLSPKVVPLYILFINNRHAPKVCVRAEESNSSIVDVQLAQEKEEEEGQ